MSATIAKCSGCGEPDGARYGAKQVCWECWAKQNGAEREIPPPPPTPVDAATISTLEDFAAVDEPGAEPIVGNGDSILIPLGGDVMAYGDGGAGKTTLLIDAALHMAAGVDWIGLPVARTVRVLLIECEGPRALFRKKLRRKLESWDGPPVGNRVHVLEAPWAQFTFASEQWRDELAAAVIERQIDVIIAGPLTRLGMDGAGTLQEVSGFMALIGDLRAKTDRILTVILIHHENKGGAVSGAWEGSGDTLFHVQEAGNGHTVLTVQKARWSSEHHGQTLKLKWADGESFEPEEKKDAFALMVDLLADGVWRTTTEIGKEIHVRPTEARDLLNAESNAGRFVMRTGKDAEAIGRHTSSKIYQMAGCPDAGTTRDNLPVQDRLDEQVVRSSGPIGTTGRGDDPPNDDQSLSGDWDNPR